MLSKTKDWVNALLAVLVVLFIALASFFLWVLLAEKSGAVARLLDIIGKTEVLRLIGWSMGGVLVAIGMIALNFRVMSGMLSKIKYRVIILWHRVRQILSQPINALLALLVMLLVTLASFFLWALATDKGGTVARLLEIDDKAEVLRLIGWGMGGLLAAIGVIALNRRAAAMEKGLIDERFKAAVQSLAGEQPSVRIAAFYQFYYLAKDNLNMDFKRSIFDILCAHLRQMTREDDYRNGAGQEEPTEECQSLLDVLFKMPHKIFAGMAANLQGACFVKAHLVNANLQRADFGNATLENAFFLSANLENSYFNRATLRHAFFVSAKLQNAKFWSADLQHAHFDYAHLQGADFSHVDKDKIEKASFDNIRMDANTKLPEWFREGEHYTVYKK